MNSDPQRPDGRKPPVPRPYQSPSPIEEPEPEDLPDEKRTPNPDEVRDPPIHTGRYLLSMSPIQRTRVIATRHSIWCDAKSRDDGGAR